MPLANRVRVDLGQRSYDIEIGGGLLQQAGPQITQRLRVTHAVVIADANVISPHAEIVCQSLLSTGAKVDLLTVASGENSKSFSVLNDLWQKMLALGADRKTVVVAVGGGVIGDLAGFVAASFTRGLAFVQIPTTLLAQVDSSVGGKVGINLPTAKNMVGAFWQPSLVLIDPPATLATLPAREYRSGLAEVVKYGVILDADFFGLLERHVTELNTRDPAILGKVIARCCRLKADVVEKDERETTGLRAVLNYGHTFAHAFEAVAGYGELLHGEAVSIGMICASRLSEQLQRVDAHFTRRQYELLAKLDLPVEVPALPQDALVAAMRHDKKVEHGRLRFVLPTRLGHVEMVSDVPESAVRQALVK